MYDFIIVGAGISGLYLGNYLKDQNKNFLILESKLRTGGRIKTINYKDISYESGAYRFTKNHYRLIRLINKLGLNKFINKMDKNKKFFLRNSNKEKKYNTSYNLNYHEIIENISKKKNDILINNDILTLVNKYYDSETSNYIKDYCGYDNFIENSNGYNLINHKKIINSEFYNLTCGFSKITELLFESIKKEIILGEKIVDIKNKKNIYHVITNKKKYECQKIIITIPKENLLEIPFIKNNIYYLDSVSSSPYLRVFAIYPKKKGKYGLKI